MNGTLNNSKRRPPVCQKRRAFTLLELILAVALSATLLGLIGTAINLYLSQVDVDRTRVEEAQLARSVLAMIADDIRGATIYQPQDTKAIEALMAASSPYNVDDVDKQKVGAPAAPAQPKTATALSSTSSSSSSSTSSGSSNDNSDETLPLGLNGTTEDVYVDVTRLPGQEELFSTVTGYTNAQSPATGAGGSGSAASANSGDSNPPADLKTVHYYVRSDGGSMPTTPQASTAMPTASSGENGLVRQEIPRPVRAFAEQAGNTNSLESHDVLIAPEVVQLQFRYFSGSGLFDMWEMKERKSLPAAIEVKIWLKSPSSNDNNDSKDQDDRRTNNSSLDTIENAHEYRQIVYLPMASLTQSSSTSQSSTSGESQGGETVQQGQDVFNQN